MELSMQGYRFFLLKDVKRIEGFIPASYILQPVKAIPVSQGFSCLGLHDGMVISVLAGNKPHITLYIDE
ncbi:MAG: hypothetical protein EOP56_04835 [Sphingobacteriales bacterium]|nr:MAG: hypothetical protein EOP56_04835 [Sphingobacteriales bacterium]